LKRQEEQDRDRQPQEDTSEDESPILEVTFMEQCDPTVDTGMEEIMVENMEGMETAVMEDTQCMMSTRVVI